MKERVIVITGAGRGLGLALAREFARLDHVVIGCSKTQRSVQRASSALGEGHEISQVNVTEDKQVRAWAQASMSAHGPPDLLINNAGVINENAPLWEISERAFSRVVEVNICGVSNVIRRFVPSMIERGRGVIVNFSSYWGRSSSPQVAPYCASKWAIEGLTRALAEELPSGLSAVSFNPGAIDTEMLRSCFGEAAYGYPEPQDWAEPVALQLLALGPRESGTSIDASY